MDLYHLLYQSQSLAPLGPGELEALLYRGRTHNRAHNITGLLLHTADGRFLQVLEGPKTCLTRAIFIARSSVKDYVLNAALPTGRWAAA